MQTAERAEVGIRKIDRELAVELRQFGRDFRFVDIVTLLVSDHLLLDRLNCGLGLQIGLAIERAGFDETQALREFALIQCSN